MSEVIKTLTKKGDASVEVYPNIKRDNIPSGAVDTSKLDDASVTTAKIVDASVTTSKLADGSVSSAKINDGAVTTIKINDGAVTTAKIENGAITTLKIADTSVTTAKIANASITNAKLSSKCVTSGELDDNAVETTNIEDGAVTTAKINDGAVTTAKMGFHLVHYQFKLYSSVYNIRFISDIIGNSYGGIEFTPEFIFQLMYIYYRTGAKCCDITYDTLASVNASYGTISSLSEINFIDTNNNTLTLSYSDFVVENVNSVTLF